MFELSCAHFGEDATIPGYAMQAGGIIGFKFITVLLQSGPRVANSGILLIVSWVHTIWDQIINL